MHVPFASHLPPAFGPGHGAGKNARGGKEDPHFWWSSLVSWPTIAYKAAILCLSALIPFEQSSPHNRAALCTFLLVHAAMFCQWRWMYRGIFSPSPAHRLCGQFSPHGLLRIASTGAKTSPWKHTRPGDLLLQSSCRFASTRLAFATCLPMLCLCHKTCALDHCSLTDNMSQQA